MEKTKNTVKELLNKCNNEFSFKRLLITLVALVLVTLICKPIGVIGLIGLGLYETKKVIIPGVKKVFGKCKNFFKSAYSSIKQKFSKKEETMEFEHEFDRNDNLECDNTCQYEEQEKKETKTSKVKNFFVNTKEKFKKKFAVKRDTFGIKIVDGEYYFSKNNIIQDDIDWKALQEFRQYTKVR